MRAAVPCGGIEPDEPCREQANMATNYEIVATCLYADELSRATFIVSDDGTATMSKEEHLFGQMPIMQDRQLRGFRIPRQILSSAEG